MKNKIKIRLFVVSCLLGWVCLLSGCNGRKEELFLTEETDMYEELAEIEDLHDNQENTHHVSEIVVYVCGAVNSPGVVILPEDSRLNDAILAAGGFSEEAAHNSVNLAAKIKDEEMIYVSTKQEAEVSGKNELININTADINTLCSLPGIGESKARDIILYREKNGAFQNKEEIMHVEGIKENLYNKIEAMISVK